MATLWTRKTLMDGCFLLQGLMKCTLTTLFPNLCGQGEESVLDNYKYAEQVAMFVLNGLPLDNLLIVLEGKHSDY